MHLMYAIGMSPQLGIHTSRGCFEVTEFPTCSGGPSAQPEFVSPTPEQPLVEDVMMEGVPAAAETATASSASGVSAFTKTALLGATAAFFYVPINFLSFF